MEAFEKLYIELAYPGKVEFVKAAKKLGLDHLKAAEWLTAQTEQQTFKKPEQDPEEQKQYKIRMQKIQDQYDLNIYVDLMDMTRFFKSNDNYKYCLTAIEPKIKLTWAIPMKDKTAAETAKAFESIIDGLALQKPGGNHLFFVRVISDDGNEFKGAFKQYLEKHPYIRFYQVQSVKKAFTARIEAFNRAILLRLRAHFVRTNSTRWIEFIQTLMRVKNANADQAIITSIRNRTNKRELYLDKPPLLFDVGDHVRIKVKHAKFAKKTLANQLSLETYVVTAIDDKGIHLSDGKVYAQYDLVKSNNTETELPDRSIVDSESKKIKRTSALQSKSGIKAADEVKEILQDGTVVFKPRLNPASTKRIPKPKV